MKYSVIIPVYNAENSIKKCMDSLVPQLREDAEILIINDGSTDSSGIICKEYASVFPAIRYYEQENGGVSSARNIGLDHACGRYILFVDSDDYVADDYFCKIDGALEKYHSDMLMFGTQFIGVKMKECNTGQFSVSGEQEIADKIFTASRAYLFSNLMTKTFVRSIIEENNIRFDESISIGEDQLFVFEYAMNIKRLSSIKDTLYYFGCDNKESLSRKKRKYLSRQLLMVHHKMLSALESASFPENIGAEYRDIIIWMHYRSAYSSCKELLKFNYKKSVRRKKIRQICCMFTRKEMKPETWQTRLIAFPVIYRLCGLIDFFIRIRRRYDRT